MDFRIFEGEWPSFPGRTMVSASESLFPVPWSGELFGGSTSIASTVDTIGGGDDRMPFGDPVDALFTTAAFLAALPGEALDLAATLGSLCCVSISSSLSVD